MAVDFFGSRSLLRRIVLSNDTDFVVTFRHKDGAGEVTDWPVGATLTWRFDDDTQWTASIAGSLATFNIDRTLLADLSEGMGFKVLYDNGSGGQFKPYSGTVVRDD